MKSQTADDLALESGGEGHGDVDVGDLQLDVASLQRGGVPLGSIQLLDQGLGNTEHVLGLVGDNGLMVALVTRFNMTEMFSKEDFTMVKNPGKENMEIITKEGQEIKRYTPSEKQETSGKRGKKVGVAYQLESGEIIYVPE